MIRAYWSKPDTGEMNVVHDLTRKDLWINCINPSPDELAHCSSQTGAESEFLQAALDMEEGSRIEIHEKQMIILIDVPIYDENAEKELFFDTIPLGIVVLKNAIITVCLEENSVTSELEKGRVRIETFKRTRFLLQLLYKTSQIYIRYLRRIDQQTDELETEMRKATHNKKLSKLLNLQKSITYFSTSLRSNAAVVARLRRTQFASNLEGSESEKIFRMYPQDEDLLEDVETENQQATEMAEIYGRILESMGNVFSSMISNNLNIIMKFLTSITLIVSIPTLITGLLGMNVVFPFKTTQYITFWVIIGLTVFVSVLLVWILRKKDLL